MKKKFIVGLLVAVFCVAPIAASALTADEVQAKIQELLAQITALTSQIRTLQGQVDTGAVGNVVSSIVAQSGGKHRICAVLGRTLSQGVTGDDVHGLQEFLQSEGYLTVEPTGYFGTLTRDALRRWQAAEGVVSSGDAATTGWGVLGPKTRERIRFWCGDSGGIVNTERFSASPTRGSAPLTVTFSTWLSGFRINTISYMIDFGDGTSERAADCPAPADACTGPGQNTHTYTTNGIYTATLKKITDPCAGQTACRAAIHQEIVGKAQVYVGSDVACTEEYVPVCGSKQVTCITAPCDPIQQTYSNRCKAAADGATVLYEGQCRTATDPSSDPRCRQWFDGCNTCSRSTEGGIAACTLRYCPAGNTAAYCSSYFGDSSDNKAPTISGFSGPTALSVNETGTWSVKASDPEGQQLSYYISWGDEAQTAQGLQTSLPVFTQSASFTHVYSVAGTYTVRIITRDSAGKEANASITVKVTGESVVCTAQYDPVCGRPPGCANTCPTGSYCTLECRLYEPVTYSNRCYLDAVNAQFLYDGQCFDSSSLQQCSHDPYCQCNTAGQVILCQ